MDIDHDFGALSRHLSDADMRINRTNGYALQAMQIAVILREILGNSVDNVFYHVDDQYYGPDGDIHCTIYLHRERRDYDMPGTSVIREVAHMTTDGYDQIKTFSFKSFPFSAIHWNADAETFVLFLQTATMSVMEKRMTVAKIGDETSLVTLRVWNYKTSSEDEIPLCKLYESRFGGGFAIEMI